MMEPEGRRGFGGNPLLPLIGIVLVIVIVVVLALLLTGGGSEDESPPPTATVATTPTVPAGSRQESAIVEHLASTQQAAYAGDCSEANPTADVGKICSFYRGEREGVHAFVLGLTFSEGIEWVFVEMQGSNWRVTGATPITPESAGVSGIPWPLRVGAQVVVIGTGSCLNVRTQPGGDAVDCITEGSSIVLAAGPEQARDLTWWRVEGRDGWVSGDYLRYPDSTTDPVPSPTPANAGTPEATGTP